MRGTGSGVEERKGDVTEAMRAGITEALERRFGGVTEAGRRSERWRRLCEPLITTYGVMERGGRLCDIAAFLIWD